MCRALVISAKTGKAAPNKKTDKKIINIGQLFSIPSVLSKIKNAKTATQIKGKTFQNSLSKNRLICIMLNAKQQITSKKGRGWRALIVYFLIILLLLVGLHRATYVAALLRASHGVSAVEAFVACSVSYGDGAADVTGWCVVLEIHKLLVKLFHDRALCSVGAGYHGGDGFDQTVCKAVRCGLYRHFFNGLRGGCFTRLLFLNGLGLVDFFCQILCFLDQFLSGGCCFIIGWNGGGAVGCVLLSIAGDELATHPAEDIVDQALGEWDVLIAGHARRLEASVAEFVDQGDQRDAVLQGHRDTGPYNIHKPPDGAALLGHSDK